MICAENCAIFHLDQYTDDNDDDLCEGRGNCRLSAEPRVVDIPRPEQRLIIIVFAFIVIIIVFALIFIIIYDYHHHLNTHDKMDIPRPKQRLIIIVFSIARPWPAQTRSSGPNGSKGYHPVQMGSNESKWVSTGPNGFELDQKGPNGFKWVHMSLIGFTWPKRDQMGLNWSTWVQIWPRGP